MHSCTLHLALRETETERHGRSFELNAATSLRSVLYRIWKLQYESVACATASVKTCRFLLDTDEHTKITAWITSRVALVDIFTLAVLSETYSFKPWV